MSDNTVKLPFSFNLVLDFSPRTPEKAKEVAIGEMKRYWPKLIQHSNTVLEKLASKLPGVKRIYIESTTKP